MQGENSGGTSAHAWTVCGYYTATYCDTGNTFKYFWNNWGWSGSYNGYFFYDDATPGSVDYRYDQKWFEML